MSRNIQNSTILVACLCIGNLAICRSASAQSVPGPWSSTTSYTVGALAVGTDTNLYRSVKNGNLDHGPTTDKGKNWELDKVSASVSLHVPNRFANIQAALNFIEIATISGNATVTISVADGNYAYTSPITVNVPCGDRVQIIGDTSNPAACQLSFGATDGVDVFNGKSLGLFNGFTLTGSGIADGGTGIHASQRSLLQAGPAVAVSNFTNGFDSDSGSVLTCDGCQAYGCEYGFEAFGSRLIANPATSSNNHYGFLSVFGSQLDARGSASSHNSVVGFYAPNESLLLAGQTTSTGDAVSYQPSLGTSSAELSFMSASNI